MCLGIKRIDQSDIQLEGNTTGRHNIINMILNKHDQRMCMTAPLYTTCIDIQLANRGNITLI